MGETKIDKNLAERIIKSNPHLSDSEKDYLVTNGGVLDSELNNILKNTPDLSDNDIKIIKDNVKIKNSRGPHPKHVSEERKRAAKGLLQKIYEAFPHSNPDNKKEKKGNSENKT